MEEHLAESLSLPPFAALPGHAAGGAARRPDGRGRSLVCAPSPSATPPPGIAFRITADGGGGAAVEAVQIIAPKFVPREGEEDEVDVTGGTMAVVGRHPLTQGEAARIACSDDARLLLVSFTSGKLLCLDVLLSHGEDGGPAVVRFAERWAMPLAVDGPVRFPTLEFADSDRRHHFLAVAEPVDGTTSTVVRMDAASSTGSPPSANLWPLGDDVEGGRVTCASSRPGSSVTAFGTAHGALGILSGTNVAYLPHPLLDPGEESVPWKITHLHWFAPNSLAVGASRVIFDPDGDAAADEDEDDDDDPHEHQTALLIGTLSGDDPSAPAAWRWSELGDVAPFFSVPRGGGHAFHTAVLPTSSDANGAMLLAGCNAASDVALLCRQKSGAWDVLDLAEGRGVACPTDGDDAFLFPLGVATALLPAEGGARRPATLLASTDGGVTGFAPRHHARAEFFDRRAHSAAGVAGAAAPLPVSAPAREVSGVAATPRGGGGCMLSGLDVGLDDDDDDDDSGASSASSLDSLGGDDDDDDDGDEAREEAAPADAAPAAFGFAPSTFSFGGPPQPSPPRPTPGGFSFGGATAGGAATFGAAFGVTATTLGVASSPTKPAASTPQKPTSSAGAFRSGSGPVFGTASTFSGGFGALASSAENRTGFGSGAKTTQGETEPSHAFGSGISTANTGFGALAAASAPDQDAFGSPAKTVEKGEEQKEDPKAEVAKEEAPTASEPQVAPPPAFGSGGAIPTFGANGSGAGGGFSFGGFGGPGPESTPSATSPFGAFGGAGAGASLAPGMVKPLFGEKKDAAAAAVPQSTTPAKADEEAKPSSADDEGIRELLQTQPGKKAKDVFESVLADSEGSNPFLPASKFEALVEEVGEGFHGDELDKQLALVEKDGSGQITSAAFVKWYCQLLDDDGDASSQDSEIAEEKEKAEKAFDALSAGSTQIAAADFEKLIESMGTTYCAEEHRRTLKKISSVDDSSGDKVITRKAFVDWYVDWLFGDGDSDDESDADETEEQEPTNAGEVKSEGWGSMFKATEEGSWKCGVCMVTNKPSASTCAACETPKPGEEGKSSDAPAADKATAPGSIGAGGFSFGGAPAAPTSSSIGAGGFSFGGFGGKPAEKKGEEAAPASTGIGSGGFSFAAAKKADGPEPSVVKPSADDDGIGELLQTQPGKKAKDVFESVLADTEGSDPFLPTSNFEALVEEIGEGFHGDELDKQLALVEKDGSGQITCAAFVKWYCQLFDDDGDASSQDSEIAEEKEKAESAFDAISAGSLQIAAGDFEKLIESMGTTYCAEEHRRTLKKITSPDASGDKVIKRTAFVDWYVDWLFGDGDSDDESDADETDEQEPTNAGEVKSEGWGSMFKATEEGSWKCGVCMVTNKPSTTTCAACETPKPGEEGKASESPAAAKSAAPGSIGAGGFSFGGAAVPAADNSSSIGAGGFSFGGFGGKPAEKKDEEATTKSAPGGGFSFAGATNKEAPTATGIGSGGFSFGGFGAEKKADDSTPKEASKAPSAAFPPMSATAPKSPFAPKASSSAAFPPMSKAAPKPFSATPATEKPKSSAAFPPMSAAAPKNPFAKTSSSSAAAFPPMSKVAPKPFGAVPKKESEQKTPAPSSAAAFPPMSAAAPKNPFSAKPTSSSAFPPMSKAAPKPFGAFAKKEEAKPAEKAPSGAAFPPMSSVAPKSPFSATPASSSAFPPMSKAAPKPFGAFAKKEEGKPAEKASIAAFPPMSSVAPKSPFSTKPASSSAFPPMSKAAPKPFGAFAKKEESKPAEQASGGAAFPPMASAAPKPFGAFAKKEESKAPEKPSSSAFPPMSKAAPKPFGAFGKKEESKVSTASTTTFGTSAGPTPSKPSFAVSSRYEAELWGQVKQFSAKTAMAKKLTQEVSSCVSSDLENDIQSMVNKYHEKVSNAELFTDKNAAAQKRLLHLLSVQDDLERQKKDSRLALEEQNSDQAASNLARKEPLDFESEKMRRSIVSKCHEVQTLMSNVESRLALNRDIFTTGAEHGTVRASDYFNQWSKTPPMSRQQTAKGATNALFKQLTGGYDRVRDFDSFVQYISEKSKDMADSHESKSRGTAQSSVKRTKNSRGRLSLSPLPTSHLTSPLVSRRKAPLDRSSIVERQNSLREMAKELSANRQPTSKEFHLRGQMARKPSDHSNIPDWRSKGRNELFSNSKTLNQTSLVPAAITSPAVVKTLFSSPKPATRSDWESSECDKSNLKVNIPQKLKHINQADAAKAALAKFGTTPEKLAEGRDIISRDDAESKAPLIPPARKLAPAAAKTSPPAGLSKSKTAAAFPPMPTTAPKPLSQALKPSTPPTKPPAAPAPAAAANAVDYKPYLTRFYQENSPGKVAEVEATLQKYQGKEPEMFVKLAMKYNKPNALNELFLARLKDIDRNDLVALTKLYIQVFNPSKAAGAEKYLSQHKGKEADMFAKLSEKWRTVNPLEVEGTATAPPAAAPPTAQPQNLFAPKPDEKPSASAPAPSPFGSASASAPAPSPFGSASAPGPSPFASASAPGPSPFAAASAPSPTPFASGGAPASSAFGTKSEPVGTGAATDYHKLLTDFYQQHNAAKIAEVGKTLEKYKGREADLFAKLAKKYKSVNPLNAPPTTAPATASGGFGFGGMSASVGSSQSPFGGGGDSKSPFGGASTTTTSSATTAPMSNASPFGTTPAAPAASPFGAASAAPTASKSPFGTTPAASAPAPSPFGTTPAAPAPSPFGNASSSAFGTGATLGASPSPFGSASGASAFGSSAPAPATPFGSSSAFGSAPAAPASAFGQAPAAPAAAKFGGRNPRDILVSFYQSHNPQKLGDVDKVMAKYAGKEEQLFLNLAKKYNLDPSQFGVSQPVAAAPTGAATFGSPATMGMGSSSGFGASAGGFGASSGGFGASSGFAAAAQAGAGGFGSLAASPAGGGFGGFGGGASFQSQTPFGAARR